MNDWAQLILGIGFGTIVSSLLTSYFQKKKFLFETKLIKYSNLIQAYQNVVANPNEIERQNFVSNQKQVELIGTNEIIKLSQEFYNRNDEVSNKVTRDQLVKAMRKDLNRYC